jgi:hypothetical protein
MALRVPLSAEILLARAAAGLSRLARAGGGTTVPGKLLWKLDPGAVDRLAARLPAGSALISATNGKTTTSAMAARILGPSFRLAHNHSGANLVSGVASALLASSDAQLGLFEVDEGALPEIAQRVVDSLHEGVKLGHYTPFWRGESYDRWVRSEEEWNRIAGYIEQNPVKAGLVPTPEAYPCSSAQAPA